MTISAKIFHSPHGACNHIQQLERHSLRSHTLCIGRIRRHSSQCFQRLQLRRGCCSAPRDRVPSWWLPYWVICSFLWCLVKLFRQLVGWNVYVVYFTIAMSVRMLIVQNHYILSSQFCAITKDLIRLLLDGTLTCKSLPPHPH